MSAVEAARHDVLIVGAGQAGAQAAISLRQEGFEGSIALVGDEPDPPYERPPLSKEFLLGDKSFERMLIRPRAFWAERRIDLLLNRRVRDVDPAGRRVTTQAGETLAYGELIWAAGGAPRSLTCDGHHYAGVHAIRTRADVERLRGELSQVRHVVIVGGGYVGLEAAAALTKLGKSVTLVEALDRVLARVAGEALSRFFEGVHRAHGVDLRLNAAVSRIVGENDKVTGVVLADGSALAADMVVVGIGVTPAVQPLIAAGAMGANGVDVDEFCHTNLAHIHAIGDCAAHVNAHAGGVRMRVESVQNANDQGRVVAKAICGAGAPYEAIPWFWSNQYDLRLQTIGLSVGHDAEVLRGDPRGGAFSVVYLRGGRVCALDCVNVTRDFAQGKALVLAGAVIAPDDLADASRSLKDLLAAASGAPRGGDLAPNHTLPY